MDYLSKLCWLLIPLIGCQPAENSNQFSQDYNWVDLSYPFDENTIYWPTDTLGFHIDTVFHGFTEQEFFYCAYSFRSAEHGGTHLDAPVHFAEGQQAVDAIPITRLVGDAVVIDVSESALKDADYLVSVEDFEQWESVHGPIPQDAMVLLRTGYGAFWPDRERYLGTAALGPDAVSQLHFPGLDPQAARWLAEQRKIKAIGLDTPSIDFGQSQLFESHRILFQHNIPVFENLANLDQLPVTGSWMVALPMSIAGGSGAPLRAIARVPAN